MCAPGSLARRLTQLLMAGLVLAAVSLAWMVAVDATPASQRPYVGGSDDNSELQLAFGYNGFGRVGGELGGPGAVPEQFELPQTGSASAAARARATAPTALPAPEVDPHVHHTITTSPVNFGRGAGPLRLFEKGMGDQGAWLLPFALLGLIALALRRRSRRDPRTAALLVLGGYFVVEAVVLSFSKGIVHPYYVSALGPGVAAMVGAGAATIAELTGRRRLLLAALALLACAAVQVALLLDAHYLRGWVICLSVTSVAAVIILAWRPPALKRVLWGSLALLLVAPAIYSATTWERPVDDTFPAAGPHIGGGYGGAGVSPVELAATRRLVGYVLAHEPGSRFQLLTEASLPAATPILLGVRAAALGGYGGYDPALNAGRLGRLVARGQARYVLIGGSYAYLGGNAASRAAERVCPQVPRALWSGADPAASTGFYLLTAAVPRPG